MAVKNWVNKTLFRMVALVLVYDPVRSTYVTDFVTVAKAYQTRTGTVCWKLFSAALADIGVQPATKPVAVTDANGRIKVHPVGHPLAGTNVWALDANGQIGVFTNHCVGHPWQLQMHAPQDMVFAGGSKANDFSAFASLGEDKELISKLIVDRPVTGNGRQASPAHVPAPNAPAPPAPTAVETKPEDIPF